MTPSHIPALDNLCHLSYIFIHDSLSTNEALMSSNKIFHPSYGFLSPETVNDLRAAKWDGSYAAFKDKVLNEGSVRKPRAKKIKTVYMFTPETDGKVGV